MTDALKLSYGVAKRSFTVAVVIATILWSVAATFAVAPRAAHAASPGDLVKGSLSAVYYVGSDNKRYVFTNDKAYFTWYADFSAVKKISDTDLAALTIGGNVTYKPGVKMVKIMSDPKVYAVGHGGVLHWVSTEAAAIALYGANWNKQIDDIADSFFVNYTVGSQITVATDYVKATEQANSTTINADKGLAGGGALNITLASDNALPATVTRNAQGINLLKINIAGAGTITGLTFTRNGAGIAADWANIYLYDGDSRLTTGRSVSSTTNQVVFNNLNVAVSGSKTLTLIGDLVNPATVGNAHYFSLAAATDVVASTTVGGNFPVYGSLFTISGSTGGGITAALGSTPSDPAMGKTGAELANFKLTGGAVEDVSIRRIVISNSGAGSLSNLTNLAITTGGVTIASNPIVSGNIATFVFAVPYVLAKGITRTFSVIADISAGNRATVDTFKLYIDQTYDIYATGNTYGAGVNVTDNFTSAVAPTINIVGGQITFASNGPTTGDISVGANDAVIEKFAITSVSHVEVRDLRMRITASAALGADVANITDCKVKDSDTGVTVTNQYDLAAWTNADPVFTKIFTDRFEIAAGQTINLALTCDILSTATAALTGKSLTGTVDARVAGDIRNLDSNLDVALADIVPSSALTGNPQSVRVSGLTVGVASSPASATVTKGSTVSAVGFNFTAGSASDVKMTQLKVRGLISLDATPTVFDTVSTSVAPAVAHNVQDVIQSATLWDGTTQLGVAVSPDATNGDMNFTNLAWTIPAGTTKTITVKVILSNNLPYGTSPNLFLIDIIGAGLADLSTANLSAQDKDTNTVTGTSASWTAIDVHLNEGTAAAQGVATTLTTTDAVVITVVRSGTLQVQLDGDTPTPAIITASTSDNSVTRLKFSSINEGFSVTRLTVQNTNAASSRSITSVRLFDKNGTLFCSGTLDSTNRLRCANDAGLFTVANDQVVTIKLNIDTIGATTTGGRPVMALYTSMQAGGLADDIKAVGISSGTALLDADVRAPGDTGPAGITFALAPFKVFADAGYVADSYDNPATAPALISGAVSVLRKTQPTVATVAVSSTLVNGEQTVYKFSVTAASNADVGLKQFTLNMSRSGVGLGAYRIFENGTAVDPTLYTIFGNIALAGAANPIDLTVPSATASSANGGVIKVLFKTERSVAAGTTKTYDVKATVDSASAGDSLSHVLADDTLSEGTNDAGFAMNLGTNFFIFDATHGLFDTNRDGLVTAGESEITLPGNAGATAQVGNYIVNGNLIADGTQVFIDLNGNGTYDAASDIRLVASAIASAHTTLDYALVDDLTRVYADVNYNGVYNVGTDIPFVTTADLTAAGLVNAKGTNFVWSDISGDAHSRVTTDWTNGNLVKTLPTTSQSLSL